MEYIFRNRGNQFTFDDTSCHIKNGYTIYYDLKLMSMWNLISAELTKKEIIVKKTVKKFFITKNVEEKIIENEIIIKYHPNCISDEIKQVTVIVENDELGKAKTVVSKLNKLIEDKNQLEIQKKEEEERKRKEREEAKREHLEKVKRCREKVENDEQEFKRLNKLCADIHKEYKNLLKKYSTLDIEIDEDLMVETLKELWRKLSVIETNIEYYDCYDDIDIELEQDKVRKKAHTFINKYIKREREDGVDKEDIDLYIFYDDLDFIYDYISDKEDKLSGY